MLSILFKNGVQIGAVGTKMTMNRDEDKLYKVSAADLSVQGEVATGDEPHGVAYRP